MDDEKRGLLERLVHGKGGPAPEPKPMTRGQQTVWIIGAMAIIAFLGFNYLESHDASDPYARCKSVFAKANCQSDVAMERLRTLD